MYNLTQLQQQIVSEAVKAFREKFPCIQSDCDGTGTVAVQVGDDVEAEQCEFHGKYLFPIEKLLTDQLNQAMRKVAGKMIDDLEKEYESQPSQVQDAVEFCRSWLNQDSEGNL